MWHGFSEGLVDCRRTAAADIYSLLGVAWSWHVKHTQLKKNCLRHITLGLAFSQVNLTKLRSGRIDCRDAFLAAFCFKDCISGPTKLSTKLTGLWTFHKIMCASPGQEEHNLCSHSFFWSGVHKFTNWLVTCGRISACGTYHLCGFQACAYISEKALEPVV